MKIQKKGTMFLALLLMSVLWCIIPQTIKADDSQFAVDSNGVLTDINYPSNIIVVPTEVNGIRITSVGSFAMSGWQGTTKIVLPEGITSIGDYAMKGCINLTSVVLPKSLTSIGEGAFDSCNKLTDIAIPESVTSIGGSAFSTCVSLTIIKIPEGITSIEDYTFSYCRSLTSIMIPESVTSIGMCAFSYCESLKNIMIPGHITFIGMEAFNHCKSLTSLTIPENVAEIHPGALLFCDNLKSVKIYNDDIIIIDSYFESFDKSPLCGKGNTLVTLYGHKNSNTELYAKKWGYKFEELPDGSDKPLQNIILAKSQITVGVGKTALNSIIYNPTDTTDDKIVKWSSSDPEIAFVYSNGKVKGIRSGTATITATVGDKTATCTVTVK